MDVLTGMDGVLVLATAIGVIVAAVMQLVKMTYSAARSGKEINHNWIPLLSVIVGALIGLAVAPFTTMDLMLRLWAGAISGFMASGIYETVKKTTKL